MSEIFYVIVGLALATWEIIKPFATVLLVLIGLVLGFKYLVLDITKKLDDAVSHLRDTNGKIGELLHRLDSIDSKISALNLNIEELDWWSEGKSTFAKQLFKRLDSIENEIVKSDKSIEGLEWWNEGTFAKQLFERLARIEGKIGKSDKYIEELDWWSQGKSTFAKQLFERLDNIEKVIGKM